MLGLSGTLSYVVFVYLCICIFVYLYFCICMFDSWKYHFYRTQVYLGSDLWVPISVTEYLREVVADLIDVTLADKDTNSILKLIMSTGHPKQCSHESASTWWSTLKSIKEMSFTTTFGNRFINCRTGNRKTKPIRSFYVYLLS